MEEPKYILENGTWVKINDVIGAPTGFMVKKEILDKREGGLLGQICGCLAGHGGDVYWVRHKGEVNVGSAYGWWEFNLINK